jgi:hypothetical protein
MLLEDIMDARAAGSGVRTASGLVFFMRALQTLELGTIYTS